MTSAAPAPQDDRRSDAEDAVEGDVAAALGLPAEETPEAAAKPPAKPRKPRSTTPRTSSGEKKAAPRKPRRPSAPRATAVVPPTPPLPEIPADVAAAAYAAPKEADVALTEPDVLSTDADADVPTDATGDRNEVAVDDASEDVSSVTDGAADAYPAADESASADETAVVELPDVDEVAPEPLAVTIDATDADHDAASTREPARQPEPEPEPDAGPETEPVEDAAATIDGIESDLAPADAEAGADDADLSVDSVLGIDDALAPAITSESDARSDEAGAPWALRLRGLTKTYGETAAVAGIDLEIPVGAFYGIVGPNGAGKTTTLSMIAGLLRPDGGSVEVAGIDLRTDAARAKRQMGILPDRLRTFDRLSGRQLLYYYGVLRGLKPAVVEHRIADLARAFDLTDALGRSVSDYSAGMTKKVMLAGAMIHSPRLLVLDEPFESVDPVSSAVILDILRAYVDHGGTVVLSSHGMDLVQRACSGVAVIVGGRVLAAGTVDEVRAGRTLEERFLELAGGTSAVEGLEWLHTFSD